jgi:hypothetical protein
LNQKLPSFAGLDTRELVFTKQDSGLVKSYQ